jgi:hypothetical protein
LVQVEQADAVLVVGVFDGLPQRSILLVHGVRARRGGVAREGEGAQFDSDPQERGSDCKFGCRAIALHAFQKRVRSAPRFLEMGLLVGFKLRLARSNCFG